MEKRVIKMSEILEDLEQGLTRAEIKEKYSLTVREMGVLFSHPNLKNRKPKKKLELSFVFEEDVVTQQETVQNEVVKSGNVEPGNVEPGNLTEYKAEPVIDENVAYPTERLDPFDIH